MRVTESRMKGTKVVATFIDGKLVFSKRYRE